MKFISADGCEISVGDSIWVKHDDGSCELKKVASIESPYKLLYETPCSKGYIGARYSVVYKFKPTCSAGSADFADNEVALGSIPRRRTVIMSKSRVVFYSDSEVHLEFDNEKEADIFRDWLKKEGFKLFLEYFKGV